MKKLPKFKSEDEERKFWAKHSPLDYIDRKNIHPAVFPNLKPSSRTISLRLPEALVESIKVLANRKDVPYQSMLKMLLAEKVREEFSISKKHTSAGTS
ncbi:MAG: BrnA antitoxin family protein [Bacteroidetes bacterium]|nr:BrnA antitoxin family protein [Bacteroidota bacterium]